MKENDKKEQQNENILSPKILERFKEIGHQKGVSLNPKVVTKLIESSGSIEMYLTEYNPNNNTAYGFVTLSFMDLIDAEFKYVDMHVLQQMKEMGETTMYMDKTFKECHLNACIPANLYKEEIKKNQ